MIGVNVITKDLRKYFRLPSSRLALYNLCILNQTTNSIVEFLKDVQIGIHKVPYTVSFTVMITIVVDDFYAMLLGQIWLSNLKFPMIGIQRW